MRFDVLTLFPGIFTSFLEESLLKSAIDGGLVQVSLHNIRDWADDRHGTVDDTPYGGGAGMVMKVDKVVPCVEDVQAAAPTAGRLLLMSPQGRRLDQPLVEELAREERLLLLCGRYEGFDERVVEILRPQEVSLGDFILNGGEVAAMAVIESVIRLIPGVLGDADSARYDSFSSGNRILEEPQYTRPREYRGHEVPEILLSGDHGRVDQWRAQQRVLRTRERRPDLLEKSQENTAAPAEKRSGAGENNK
ncbi:MAG: tRNA (guanosine(37)-N1)-methyltransferase TrmD [Thermoguttaceae bacterium]|nr:tRNA (guanosine(37)-N1)-methyltransferase TrmD [Thermoguttaceae bacterium]